MDEKQNVTNEIKIENNIEILQNYFPNCFDKGGKFNLEKFKEEIKINEINLSKESYDLEWLGKSYARVLTFEPSRTLLKEDEGWNNKSENKNSGNILIKGDNLEVLKHLANAYPEKIKMIYIDPPYNTGNDDFFYQDDRKFTVEELSELAGIDEERAKRILDFVNSKSNSHSAWLTFMYPRLYIARRLLKDDGVIFVSIDDNEVAQLRLLMDEIFGEENFVESFIWRRRKTQANLSKYTASVHDYILCYTKNKEKLIINKVPYSKEFIKKTFKNPDKDPKGVYQTGPLARPDNSSNKSYELTMPNGRKITAKWSCSQETFDKYVRENRLVIPRNGEGMPRIKIYLFELKGQIPNSWLDNIATNDEASKEIELFFGTNAIFTSPKPTGLIRHLLKLGSSSNDIILDFFAGSGTTGDAVMQVNAEDGGNRKYILVQLPEPINPEKKKTAYDFVKNELGQENPTIFHICKERLIRAAKKIKEETIDKKIEEKKKEIKQLESKLDLEENKEKINQLKEEIETLKNQDLGFKIFETIPIWEDYLLDEKELKEKTTLFDVNKLTDDDLKALLITWRTYDGLPLTEGCKEVKLDDYTTYYCGTNLYLLHSNWKTENIKVLLEKIDLDDDFVVEKIIVFGYNFTSKHLREIEENIRNYSNKKEINLKTILRFERVNL